MPDLRDIDERLDRLDAIERRLAATLLSFEVRLAQLAQLQHLLELSRTDDRSPMIQ